MKPRVVYWNNIPAPYMVERFNALVERGNVDLEVWFSTRTESDRSWHVVEASWRFPYRYLPAIPGRRATAIPLPVLRSCPDVLVSIYASPSFLLGSTVARMRGIRTAYWLEVTFDAWVTRRRWKERLKSEFLPRVDGILTAGRDGAAFAMRYGVSPDRIFTVPHVIDFDRYAKGSARARASRETVRSRLGLRGVTFAYVGRLWAGKGLDQLLDAFAGLKRENTHDVSLLLVGDGIDEARLRKRCADERLEDVVFAGFHDGDALPPLYASADVFVFPTLGDPFGMVVLEAMACGLPVISTSAAGEIADRIDEGVNGFVVPPADAEALRARMELLAGDQSLRSRMGEAATAKVAGQSPHLWAEAFEDAVDKLLAQPRRSRTSRIACGT
jgi:glycosyltransferase involved in cell wall biosynthesis